MQSAQSAQQSGSAPDNSLNTTLVIACGAIAHELMAVIKANHWQHLSVQCLPAEWHNSPERITPAVEKKIKELRHRYARVVVAYADCGTGGQLDELLARYDIERLHGDHCYSFFSGESVFNTMAEQELGTFYLTDYLVDNFQRLIMDGLGINKHPQLLEQYFGNYTQLMYLRQDSHSEKREQRLEQAQLAAKALNLRLSVYDTGLQPFTQSLSGIRISIESASSNRIVAS